MSKAQHTPGPLTVRTTVHGIETVNEAGEVVLSMDWPAFSSSDKTVDDVLECRNHPTDNRHEYSQANKRALADEVLRAAAPELLDELDSLVRRLARLYPGFETTSARAAIAKAKGE